MGATWARFAFAMPYVVAAKLANPWIGLTGQALHGTHAGLLDLRP